MKVRIKDAAFNLDTVLCCYHIYTSTYERAFKKRGFEDIEIFDTKIPETLTDEEKEYFSDFI